MVLGAGGFIGRALSARLAARGVLARTITRANSGTLSRTTDWPRLLDGAQAVVHLASPAKIGGRDRGLADEAIGLAETLKDAAIRSGVVRTIVLSSIKAMGGRSGDTALRAGDAASPVDDYGRMKQAIERALDGAPGLAILRPPLVYGPGVKGNFRLLLDLAARGWPLPLASIENRRAFIFVENLLDLIETLLAPAAPDGVYLMRDDEEISTPELLRRMAVHMGRKPHLMPFPPRLLRLPFALAGRSGGADALLGSLTIDDSDTRARLDWRPQISLNDGLAATCRWFIGNTA